MQEYRTQEQFNTIADNTINGNWSVAFKNVEEFGFYAEDLIEFFREDNQGLEIDDLVYLAQGGQKEREDYNV